MNLGRVFASAAVRKLAYILVAGACAFIASMFVPGKAHATEGCPFGIAGACNVQQARIACEADVSAFVAPAGGHSPVCSTMGESQTASSGNWRALYTTSTGSQTFIQPHPNHYWRYSCPANTIWNPTFGRCELVCSGGYKEDPFNPGTCMDNQKCNALNSGLGTATRTWTGTEQCKASCKLVLDNPTVTVVNGTTGSFQTGVARYTGESCAAQSPPTTDEVEEVKTPKPQECTPADSSLTKVCVKSNGEKCMTAPRTGLHICWQAGETGQKTQDDVLQKRVPGPTEQPPVVPLPNGDTVTKHGDSKTITETNTTRTTTTTITNYTTTNGTNAGTTNSGQPSSGVGTQTPGTGEGTDDNEEKTASGGQDCTEAGKPVVNGDPHLQMVALQAWATRCAVESKDAITSSGEIGDCSTNFTISGPEKSAALLKLKGLREQICGPDKNLKDGDPNGPGDLNSNSAELEGDSSSTFAVEGEEQGTEGLDDVGFGFSRACPVMPTIDVLGTSVHFDNSVMCDWLALGGLFVLVIAGLASLRILAGGGV